MHIQSHRTMLPREGEGEGEGEGEKERKRATAIALGKLNGPHESRSSARFAKIHGTLHNAPTANYYYYGGGQRNKIEWGLVFSLPKSNLSSCHPIWWILLELSYLPTYPPKGVDLNCSATHTQRSLFNFSKPHAHLETLCDPNSVVY